MGEIRVEKEKYPELFLSHEHIKTTNTYIKIWEWPEDL